MPDPYNEFYAAFLKDHPEELAGVKMCAIDGTPQLMMTSATIRHFLQWALGMGLVGNVEKAFGFLADIPNLDDRMRKAFTTQTAAPQHDDLILREPQT